MSQFTVRAAVDRLDVGVLAGDLVSVERAGSAEPGVLVVALVAGVGTVKRCEPGDDVQGRVLEVAGRRG